MGRAWGVVVLLAVAVANCGPGDPPPAAPSTDDPSTTPQEAVVPSAVLAGATEIDPNEFDESVENEPTIDPDAVVRFGELMLGAASARSHESIDESADHHAVRTAVRAALAGAFESSETAEVIEKVRKGTEDDDDESKRSAVIGLMESLGQPGMHESAGVPQSFHVFEAKHVALLYDVLDALGPATPDVVLDLVIADWNQQKFVTVQIEAPDDERRAPLDVYLRERATPELDLRLAAILRDRESSDRLRIMAAIALCRRGHGPASIGLAALIDAALDTSDEPAVRAALLQRLPRLDIRAPRALRELLYASTMRRGIEPAVAATLARMGDPEAPSLLAQGVDVGRRSTMARLGHLDHVIQGMRVFVGDEPWFEELSVAARESVLNTDPNFTSEEEFAERRATRKALADRFREWLAAHPDVRRTTFEQRLAKWRAEAAGIDARTTLPLDAWTKRPEGEWDLGEALISRLNEYYQYYDKPQARVRLERLCHLMRVELARAETADERLEAFRRRVFAFPEPYVVANQSYQPPGVERRFVGSRGQAMLPESLRAGPSLPLCRVVLAMAVADRLGLPVQPVVAPGHVFVRWSEGELVRDLEPLELGADRDLDWETARTPPLTIAPRAIGEGRYFRILTDRELVALVVARDAELFVLSGLYERGVEHARRALALDPDCPTARLQIVWGLSGLDPVPSEEVVHAAAQLRASGALSARETHLLAESLVRAGRPGLAREAIETHARECPDNPLLDDLRAIVDADEE